MEQQVFVDEASFLHQREDVFMKLVAEFGWVALKLKQEQNEQQLLQELRFEYRPIQNEFSA